MANKQRSVSGAFLIELLIIIAVFAVCAAIGISVIAMADKELKYSESLTASKHISAEIAERYKGGESVENLCKPEYVTAMADKSQLKVDIQQRQGEYVDYLDIKVYDENYTYITVTCAREVADNG